MTLHVVRGTGYQLTGDFTMDTDAFAELVARGRSSFDEGDPAGASTALREALELWRGPALSDIRHTGTGYFLDSTAAGLDEGRAAAQKLLMDAELALGNHDRIIGELESLARQHMFRSDFQAQLMIALYRSGRTSDALKVFLRHRRVMVEELGLEPDPVLNQLHTRILSRDLSPETALVTRGVAARPVPRMVPAARMVFTGRTGEIERCLRWFAEAEEGTAPRLLCVTGSPGVGKSAFVAKLAQSLQDEFVDGQLYARLGPAREGEDPVDTALVTLLQALGVPSKDVPPWPEERAAVFRSAIAARRVLLVLDDVDEPDQVLPLLPTGSGPLLLVCSRHSLRALGGVVLHLGPLADDEALALLERLVGVDRVSADPAAASRLLERCANLPLAIHLVARAVERDGRSIADVASWPAGPHGHGHDLVRQVEDLVAGLS